LDVNARDSSGDTCLHKFAKLSTLHFDCYPYKKQNLIGRVNPAEYDDITDTKGIWPSTSMVSILLEHKIDCTILNMQRQTPYSLFCEMGWLSIATMMIQTGAIDVKFDEWPRILNGSTPLHHILHCYHVSKDTDGEALLNQTIPGMLKNGADTNARSWNLQTPLHVACALGLDNVAHLIAKHKGTNVNLQDQNGRTPLHYVIENWIFDNNPLHVATALCLIECGADLSVKDDNHVLVGDYVAIMLREKPSNVRTCDEYIEFQKNKINPPSPPSPPPFFVPYSNPFGFRRYDSDFNNKEEVKQARKKNLQEDEYQVLTKKLSDILNQGQK